MTIELGIFSLLLEYPKAIGSLDTRDWCSPGGTGPFRGGLIMYLQAVLDIDEYQPEGKKLSGCVSGCSDELLACFMAVIKSGVFRKV